MADNEKYSAEWVREKVEAKGAQWLTNHDCAICREDVGYVFQGDDVWYRSACGCSWSEDRPSSYQAVAKWLAMQSGDEIRDRIMERLA